MMSCIVRHCRSRWTPKSDIIFHSFPKDDERRRHWLTIVPIKGKFSNSSKICSLHFRAEDYNPINPKYLSHSANPYYLPLDCGCGAENVLETANLCRWPRSVDLQRVWLDLLRSHTSRLSSLTHRNRIHRHAYVCQFHFEEKFIKDNKRVPLSWPTLFSEEEISIRRPTHPVTAFKSVRDHSYAVAPWTKVDLVPQKRKWTGEDIELASNVKTLCHDHNYVYNPNKTIKLTLYSQDGESGLHMPDISRVATTPAGGVAVGNRKSLVQVTTTKRAGTLDTTFNTKLDVITKAGITETASLKTAAISKAAVITYQETPLTLSETNDDRLQLIEETQVDSNFEYTIEADEEGPFSWQKSIIVPCDKKEIVGSELSSQLIDDDVLLYDSEPHYSHAAQDIFAEETDEILEELKCNLCENIIKGGFRYSCVQCPDFDLCDACEAKGAHRMHYVLRSPGTKAISEVQLMLRLIRQAILADSIVSLRDHFSGNNGTMRLFDWERVLFPAPCTHLVRPVVAWARPRVVMFITS